MGQTSTGAQAQTYFQSNHNLFSKPNQGVLLPKLNHVVLVQLRLLHNVIRVLKTATINGHI